MKNKRLVLLLLLSVFLILNVVLLYFVNRADYNYTNQNSFYTQTSGIEDGVMILVPHEDDELFVASNVIRNSVLKGVPVYIIYTTNGDYEGVSEERIDEAISTMALLGVPEEHVIFLGYGDLWNTSYKHIYHAPADDVITSYNGLKETYGIASHPDFRTAISGEPSPYTRSNYVKDIQDVILHYKPSEIYAVDFDMHPDHRALSLFFDEAMHSILSQNNEYTPRIYKGYSYSTSYFNAKDFYELTMESTTLPTKDMLSTQTYALDTPNNDWNQRVRTMVPGDMLSYTLKANLFYEGLKGHGSQYVVFQAEHAINSDKVFWERRSDSLTYNAQLTTTSGNAAFVNDFKLFDTDNIMKKQCEFTAASWIPSETDPLKTIRYDFEQPVAIGSVSLYDNITLRDNILSGELTFSDGSKVAVNELNTNGSATVIEFEEKQAIESVEFTILSYEGDAPGLCEWEVFPSIQRPVEFIKVVQDNATQTFLYTYLMPKSNTLEFSVYAYPTHQDNFMGEEEDLSREEELSKYKITLSKDSMITDLTHQSSIELPTSILPETYELKIALVENPEIYDVVEVVSYNFLQQAQIKTLQNYERVIEGLSNITLKIKRRLIKIVN